MTSLSGELYLINISFFSHNHVEIASFFLFNWTWLLTRETSSADVAWTFLDVRLLIVVLQKWTKIHARFRAVLILWSCWASFYNLHREKFLSWISCYAWGLLSRAWFDKWCWHLFGCDVDWDQRSFLGWAVLILNCFSRQGGRMLEAILLILWQSSHVLVCWFFVGLNSRLDIHILAFSFEGRETFLNILFHSLHFQQFGFVVLINFSLQIEHLCFLRHGCHSFLSLNCLWSTLISYVYAINIHKAILFYLLHFCWKCNVS